MFQVKPPNAVKAVHTGMDTNSCISTLLIAVGHFNKFFPDVEVPAL